MCEFLYVYVVVMMIRRSELVELFGFAGGREAPLGHVTKLLPQQTVVGVVAPQFAHLWRSSQANRIQVGEYLTRYHFGQAADHVAAIGVAVDVRLLHFHWQYMILLRSAMLH